MKKQDLVNEISSATTIESNVVNAVMNAYMRVVKGELTTGGEVTLRGFGTFYCKRRAAKTGRNILKGTPVKIPAHTIPYFKPAQEFKDAVKNTHHAKEGKLL